MDGLFYNALENEYTIVEIKTINNFHYDEKPNEAWVRQLQFYVWLFLNQTSVSLGKIHDLLGLNERQNLLSSDNINGEIHVINPLSQHRWKHPITLLPIDMNYQLQEALKLAFRYFLPRINHVEHFRIVSKLPWFFDEYRQGQQDNLKKLRSSLSNQNINLVTGPPGTGKTALTLKVMIEKAILSDKQVFFSSAKNTQQIEVLRLLKQINVQLKHPLWVVVLTAIDRYCIRDVECDPKDCKFFQNMKKKRVSYSDLFSKYQICDIITLQHIAKSTEQFCPYYQAKQIAGFADIIIGDQNYQLSPEARIGILTRQGHPLLFSKRDLPFFYIMDETHNLPSRIRELYTIRINLKLFKQPLPILNHRVIPQQWNLRLKKLFNKIYQFLTTLPLVETPSSNLSLSTAYELLQDNQVAGITSNETLNHMRFYSEEGEHRIIKINRQHLITLESILLENNIALLEFEEEFVNTNDLITINSFIKYWIELLFQLLAFKEGMEKSIDTVPQFQLFYQYGEDEVFLECFCLEIATYLKETLRNTPGTILMSATLYPEHFYRMIFDLEDKANYVELKNYFPRKNRLTLIIEDFNTRYRERDEALENLEVFLKTLQSIKSGTYLVFLPNLELMNSLQTVLDQKGINSFTQDSFPSPLPSPPVLLICALGSIFSEGVNIPNLTGVIILSPGTLPPSFRQNLLQEYFKLKTKASSRKTPQTS
jgi:Rad3-related DNA helicase